MRTFAPYYSNYPTLGQLFFFRKRAIPLFSNASCNVSTRTFSQNPPSTLSSSRMSKEAPPAYGFIPPQSAPPSYAQAVGGVPPASPFVPNVPQPTGPAIITTVVPVGPQTTHMICPSCHSEINTQTTTSPGLIAYVSGFLIALFG